MNGSKVRSYALVFVLLVVLLTAPAAGAAPKDGPTVSLSASQAEFAADQEVLVTVTLTNPHRHTVRVLRWFTPTEGVEESLFAVVRDGEPVAYTGPHYKRPAVTGRDYVSLKAGESISYTVNLGDYYDLAQSGDYQVFYAVASFQLFDEKGNAFRYRDSLTSEAISLKVEGRAAKGKPTPPPTPTPGATAFNACTVDQQGILLQARAAATNYASQSSSYLNSNNSGTPRYLEWFGAYSLARYTTVTNHFNDISEAFNSAGITFD
ncbi:MAG TPA: hypothetical protein VFY25_14700, partial [Anaerolineales bacterium]|nr:hypothetical protein [Anaerolineales bacterium]